MMAICTYPYLSRQVGTVLVVLVALSAAEEQKPATSTTEDKKQGKRGLFGLGYGYGGYEDLSLGGYGSYGGLAGYGGYSGLGGYGGHYDVGHVKVGFNTFVLSC